jgi:hypothetical protein
MEVLSELAQPDVLAGVLETIFAEGEDAGGVGVDLGDGGAGGDGTDLDTDLGDGADGAGTGEGEEQQGADQEKVDGRRGSKEFREALKAWGATPEGAKFAKTAQADHFRVQELATIEPGGVSAIREKYALLEAVGGAEAVTQMQERIAETDAVDAALAAGDEKALDALGPDFDPGLAKLTPKILERVMRSDPEAYAAAILPHLMSGLAGSPMVGDLNRMIDALQAPHLDEKGKLAAVTQLLGRIGKWFEANEQKAGQIKAAPVDKERTEFDQQRTRFEQEQQEAHWNNKIKPDAARAESAKFDELLRPYMAKLKLSPAQKNAAFLDFQAKLTKACNADQNYGRQRDLYRKQKNPNPATVINFVKSHLTQKAKAAFDQVKEERGWAVPTKKAGATTQQVAGARSATTQTGAAAVVVSVKPKPDEIDYRRTSEEDQWKGLYTLKTGKKVQYRKPPAA